MDKELKTSKEWQGLSNFIVLNPDGWDKQNFKFSWYIEKITKEEFDRRLIHSTVMSKKDTRRKE